MSSFYHDGIEYGGSNIMDTTLRTAETYTKERYVQEYILRNGGVAYSDILEGHIATAERQWEAIKEALK